MRCFTDCDVICKKTILLVQSIYFEIHFRISSYNLNGKHFRWPIPLQRKYTETKFLFTYTYYMTRRALRRAFGDSVNKILTILFILHTFLSFFFLTHNAIFHDTNINKTQSDISISFFYYTFPG